MGKSAGGIRLTKEPEYRKTVSQKIAQAISDIRKEGHTKQQPFSIGYIESRMATFAANNGI